MPIVHGHGPIAPLDPPAPAVGVFKSRSGRTELTVTPDNQLDIRVRSGKDLLDDKDAEALRWGVDRGRELIRDRSAGPASEEPAPAEPQEPFAFTVREGERLSLPEAVGQAVGAASVCWENPRGAGVFDSSRAKEVVDALVAFVDDLRARDSAAVLDTVDPSGAAAELVEAIRLTVEYLGVAVLPPVKGWSWFDALSKYAPHLAEEFAAQRRRVADPVAGSTVWDSAAHPDPIADFRDMAARVRRGELPDDSTRVAVENALAIERALAENARREDFAPVWAYGPVSAAMAREMLWYAVEVLATLPNVEELVTAAFGEHAERFAQRVMMARQAAEVIGPRVLRELHDAQEQLVMEQRRDEYAALRLLTVVREVATMSPAARFERQMLENGREAEPVDAEARLAAVREVADWLGKQRGQGDDGRVYADLAELKLRTALGEHRPDGPCGCPACRA